MRIVKIIKRAGLVDEDATLIADPFADDNQILGSITSAAIATPQPTQLLGAQKQEISHQKNHLCVAEEGFSLHGATSVPAHDRQRLENLCRYITRPPVAHQRIEVLSNGLISYRLKNQFSDGSTHVIFHPLKFIEKLAALIPPQKAHLIHFHGILAPHSKWRSKVVPNLPDDDNEEKVDDEKSSGKKKANSTWSKLIKRVFSDDPLICPRCASRMKIVSFIMDAATIQSILKSLGLANDMPCGNDYGRSETYLGCFLHQQGQ